MGDTQSTQKDSGKQVGGILAAEYSKNHPNYLAIVNVGIPDHNAWDEQKVHDFYARTNFKCWKGG